MSKRIRNILPLIAACWLLALLGCSAETPEQMVSSGKSRLAKGDGEAAVIEFKNALQKTPDNAEARFFLGSALLRLGRVPDAEKELSRARALGYSADEVDPLLAAAMLQLGKFKEVISEFGKRDMSTDQARASLQTTLADAYAVEGDSAAAKQSITAALKANPQYAPALLTKARLDAAEGRLDDAEALVQRSLAATPQNPVAWQFKGDLMQAKRQPAQALDAYNKAVEISPTYVPAHVSRVSLLMQQGNYDEAKARLADLKKLAPSAPATYHMQAVIALRDNDFATARDAVQQELRLLPDNPSALMLAGAIELGSGAYDTAESYLIKVANAAPSSVPARRLLAMTYLRMGQKEKAAEALRPVQDRISNDPDTLVVAGQVALANGQRNDAIKYFEKAASLNPNDVASRTALGLSQIANGQADAGFKAMESAVKLDKGSQATLALIAASVRQGQMDRALAAIHSLEQKQPGAALPHALEGSARLAQNDVAGARKGYESALAADPAYFPAALNLARLDLAEQNPAEARKRFEGVLAKEPNNVPALLALAELQERSGASKEDVLALISKAVNAEPKSLPARRALVNFYMRTREPRKAVAAAQEGLAAIPNSPELMDLLGMAQLSNAEFDRALETYRDLARKQPSSPVPYLRMAIIHEVRKDDAAAVDNLRKSIALKPDFVDAQRALAALYTRLGKTDDALAIARTVQRQRSSDTLGYMLEGDIYAATKDWDKAISAYRSAVRQAPNNTEAAIRLYAVLLTGRPEQEASNFASTWIADHPKDVGFRLAVAQTQMVRKQYPAALQTYREVLALDPSNVMALNNAAWLGSQLKDSSAMSYAEKAYQLAPGDPAVLDTYGSLLVARGDVDRGADFMRKAVAAAPKQPALRLNLAKALLQQGKKQEAKQELQVLAAMGDALPQHAEVAQLLNGL